MPDFTRVAAWRRAHAEARAQLFAAWRAQPRPLPLLRGLARAADALLREIWQAQALPTGAALVAVGGYGRGELYPHSDVDVLILLDDALDATARAAFEPLIGLFWDAGLPIGHSVRSLSECVTEAAADVTVQTNLLEARWIAGKQALCAQMRARLDADLRPLEFLRAKRREQQNRHGRFADRALLLEPNLKDSPGGLRDVQTIAWVCQAAGLPGEFGGLARAGLLSTGEARYLERTLGFLRQLRIRLHLLANRREDRLLFEYQEALARELGYAACAGMRASERLMQAYFKAARTLALANEFLLGSVQCRLQEPLPAEPLPEAVGLQRLGELIDVADPEALEHSAHKMFEVLYALQRHPELRGLSPRTLRALWRAGRRIDAGFRRDAVNRAHFLALLRAPRGVTHAFRLMHRLGILGRYLPAFARITGRMQHDLVHIHPVDEHILMVLRNLRRMAMPEFAHELPFAHRLAVEFERPEVLYLAALFHDIAKGRGGDHSRLGEIDARRFCRAHGVPNEDAKLVAWLVREHLSLSATAQKQDLSDPNVIAAFAARCGDVRRLTALYLLTVADIRGTNPAIWNSWKDKLIRELYLATRQWLEGSAPPQDPVEQKKEAARATLRLYGFPPESEARLWRQLDDLYFLRNEAQEIAWQTRRILPRLGRDPIIVCARLAPIGEGVEVVVYAPDEAALFARICAFFAGMRYSVLAAHAHVTRDGHALDSFLVMDEANRVPYRDILNYIEYELKARLAAGLPLADVQTGRLPRQLRAFPLPPRVDLSRIEGREEWLLTLVAGDRPGLLYDVARCLHDQGVDVRSARVYTLGQRAEDSFVLAGEPLLDPAARLRLEQALYDCLRVEGGGA